MNAPVATPTRDIARWATYEAEALLKALLERQVQTQDEAEEDLASKVLAACLLRRLNQINGFLMEVISHDLDQPLDSRFEDLEIGFKRERLTTPEAA